MYLAIGIVIGLLLGGGGVYLLLLQPQQKKQQELEKNHQREVKKLEREHEVRVQEAENDLRERLRTETTRLQSNIKALEEESEAKQITVEEQRTRLESLTQELEAKTATESQLQGDLEQIRTDYETRVQQLAREKEASDRARDEAIEHLQQSQTRLQTLEAELQTLKEQPPAPVDSELNDRLKEAEDQISAYEHQIQVLNDRLAQVSVAGAAAAAVATTEGESTALAERANEAIADQTQQHLQELDDLLAESDGDFNPAQLDLEWVEEDANGGLTEQQLDELDALLNMEASGETTPAPSANSFDSTDLAVVEADETPAAQQEDFPFLANGDSDSQSEELTEQFLNDLESIFDENELEVGQDDVYLGLEDLQLDSSESQPSELEVATPDQDQIDSLMDLFEESRNDENK